MRQGRHAEAREVLHAALAAAKAGTRPVLPARRQVEIHRLLANLALYSNDVDAAVDHLLAASQAAREGLGEWHPEVAFVMESLGQLSEDIGEVERAQQCFRKFEYLLERTRYASEQAGLSAAAADANAALRRNDLHGALRRLERHQTVAVELLGADHEIAVHGREMMTSIRASLASA